jgi:DNA-binding protein H-NS
LRVSRALAGNISNPAKGAYKRATVFFLEAAMAGKQLKTMDVGALLALRGKIDALLAAKRKEFEAALAALGGGGKVGNGKIAKALNGRSGKRAKAKPKYRSKKNKSLKWSGRGMLPVWMREEMKGTKLKKNDFLIK